MTMYSQIRRVLHFGVAAAIAFATACSAEPVNRDDSVQKQNAPATPANSEPNPPLSDAGPDDAGPDDAGPDAN